LLLLLFNLLFAHNSLAEEEFLPPEDAFMLQPSQVITSKSGNQLIVSWKIADGYYIYRNKIQFNAIDKTLQLGSVKLSPSETKNDPYFGDIQIYKHQVTATIDVKSNTNHNTILSLYAKSQGCASGGICYPPLKQKISFQSTELTKQPANTHKTQPLSTLNVLTN
jgi:thiol:disulfide interchange protein DsbD